MLVLSMACAVHIFILYVKRMSIMLARILSSAGDKVRAESLFCGAGSKHGFSNAC